MALRFEKIFVIRIMFLDFSYSNKIEKISNCLRFSTPVRGVYLVWENYDALKLPANIDVPRQVFLDFIEEGGPFCSSSSQVGRQKS